MKTINLDALDAPRFVERGGQTYKVGDITPRITSVIRAAEQEADVEAKMTRYYDAVALLVPGMSRLDVDNLSFKHVNAIVALATESVDAVLDAVTDPNVGSSAPIPPATELAPAIATS